MKEEEGDAQPSRAPHRALASWWPSCSCQYSWAQLSPDCGVHTSHAVSTYVGVLGHQLLALGPHHIAGLGLLIGLGVRTLEGWLVGKL